MPRKRSVPVTLASSAANSVEIDPAEVKLSLYLKRADAAYHADTLRILPEHKRRALREQAAQRKANRKLNKEVFGIASRTAAEATQRPYMVVDDMQTRQKTTARGRTLDKLPEDAKYATERFLRDFEATADGHIKAASFEMKVDGNSQEHAVHLSRLQAHQRLERLKKRLGGRLYAIATAVIRYGATATELHKLGGYEHKFMNKLIAEMYAKTAAFYGFGVDYNDRQEKAALSFVELARRNDLAEKPSP